MKTEILNSYILSFSAFLSLGGITLKATILKFENTCDKLVCAFLMVQSFVYRYCNLLPSNNPFVLVFVVRISFVKKAGIFRPLWYKKVDHLFIKRPFFPSRFTFNVRHFPKGYRRLGCKIGPDVGKSVKPSQIFSKSAGMSDSNRARIGSPFTCAYLLHDFSGPTNQDDKSQRVNRP